MHVIMPRTEARRCRFVELADVAREDVWSQEANGGAPFHFISHAFGCDPIASGCSTGRVRSSQGGPCKCAELSCRARLENEPKKPDCNSVATSPRHHLTSALPPLPAPPHTDPPHSQ